MYDNKLVLAVKVNGKVLREIGETVMVPFGAEYTLHFKNLNSLRALVRVSVDGQDAPRTSLIVPANGTADLERWLVAGKMDEGHRFRFIERTQKIEDGPRGIQAEDGLIRVEFEFERQPARIETEVIKRTYIEDYWGQCRPFYRELWCGGPGIGTSSVFTNAIGAPTAAANPYSTQTTYSSTAAGAFRGVKAASLSAEPQQVFNSSAAVKSDVGITVPGSVSDQKFSTGQWFPTDGQKHVMVLKLAGRVGEEPVAEPVTVKTRIECPTCGTKSKPGVKFCPECGTSLSIL